MTSTLAWGRVGLLLAASLSASVRAQVADGHQFTRYAGFELNVATVSEVVDRLGPAQRVETGEAGEFVASVCYRTSREFITFLTGELQGAKYLLGFTLSQLVDRPPCAAWPRTMSEPKAQVANLRLGMSRQQFQKALGASIEWKQRHASLVFISLLPLSAAEMARYSAEERKAMGVNPKWDVSVTIDADFARDRLTSLTVYKTQTN